MPELILAHDLGTTGNKASLFDIEGHLLAAAFSGYETAYPQPGWAEQDPADWWRAVCESTRRLLAESGRKADDIAVVSFSGQMMGCLPVDESGAPLRSAIIWADQRAEEEAAFIAERAGRDEVYTITGHRVSSNYSAAKILWLRRHQPDLFSRTHRVLQAKDYAVFCLTGAYATDYSDASGTNLFDLRRRVWSGAIIEALGLDPALLPEALPSHTVVGTVTSDAAVETGLAEGTPVVIGGGDGACATTGSGVVNPADAYNYIGSSSWISFVSEEPLYDPAQRTFTFAHLDPDYVFPTGTMQCAGGSYDWLERVLRGDGDERLYARLDEMAAGVEPGAQGLLFLPYLIGERSPHWNPRARGAFVGLSMVHGRAEMARATLEGVAFNLRIILDAFREQGAPIAALRLIGGGARSALWRQILSDVFNLPVLRAHLAVEATALGAAVAGGVGVGLYPDYAVAGRLVQVEPGEVPRPDVAARYEELYALFAETYEALVPVYGRIADLMGAGV
ncbi:MAG TPA: xylulokinase [Chloroflexi bacterium]|jgi:xylulokinase|nr:xylulokinase [Chloroflexota bacterium]